MLGGRVLYRQVDIEILKESCFSISTLMLGAKVGQDLFRVVGRYQKHVMFRCTRNSQSVSAD
jgi:hypothetical protein